ncbi:hypothetical protein NKI46_14535 [Mesorhizobium sp. M0615]|uniref:hypothetical protein n=1 Tax=unclassified Mesorhizobium TaxID=325217 RepID=UPI0003CF2A35|nr:MULTISPECIES: hypothetical protein [unclassified Mesorhizobium]ESY09066.1 hypothetical protein X752_22415 [Mesorhizobium sp. LNJC398B00]ESY38717.1 hypothetical protein X748_04655 [Mesorhizobium sp. LNJC386A00]
MSHSSDDTTDLLVEMAVDREIASLLAAIELEKIPDRLSKLAIELQNALVEKHRRDVKS